MSSADPTAGHDAKVNTQTPRMLCEVGSDDASPGIGPNVICQGSFVQAPAGDDQAFVTASGQFSYRSANIGIGYPHPPFDTLVPGQTYHIQGWTVVAGVGDFWETPMLVGYARVSTDLQTTDGQTDALHAPRV